MSNRTRTTVATLTALGTLAPAGVATAAYTTPKLSVSYAAVNVTRIVASAAVADDATAQVAIVIPNGTTITTTASPGTKVGTVHARVSALALGGALLPLAGDIIVAPPGAVSTALQTACIGPAVAQTTLVLVLQAAGQTINLPAYVIPTSGARVALGPAQLVFCLAPPDIPAEKGGATFGAKFLSADLTLTGVFGPVPQGFWIGFWTPWNPGTGTVNTSASVASPAVIAPGGITLRGTKARGVKRLSGRVTQAGESVTTSVTILAGSRRLATVGSDTAGTFTYVVPKRVKATTFRARVIVAGRDRPQICQAPPGSIPACVNPTISGFTATSRTVLLR